MHTSPKLRTASSTRIFLDYSTVEDAFRAVDACLFCLGISATQVSQEEYRTITYSYTLAAANMFKAKSPGATFHYISGQGTKPGSRMFWARVKAQTEHDLIELVDADCWRPAFIDAKPSAGLPKIYAADPAAGAGSSSRFPVSTSTATISAVPCCKPRSKNSVAALSKTPKSAKSPPAPRSNVAATFNACP